MTLIYLFFFKSHVLCTGSCFQASLSLEVIVEQRVDKLSTNAVLFLQRDHKPSCSEESPVTIGSTCCLCPPASKRTGLWGMRVGAVTTWKEPESLCGRPAVRHILDWTFCKKEVNICSVRSPNFMVYLSQQLTLPCVCTCVLVAQ